MDTTYITQNELPKPSETLPSSTHKAQTAEGTESEVGKLKDEIFRLAKELSTRGPHIKVAVIVQEGEYISHSYGSPDVRGVVDSYLRMNGGIVGGTSAGWEEFSGGGLTEALLASPGLYDAPISQLEQLSQQANSLALSASSAFNIPNTAYSQLLPDIDYHGGSVDLNTTNHDELVGPWYADITQAEDIYGLFDWPKLYELPSNSAEESLVGPGDTGGGVLFGSAHRSVSTHTLIPIDEVIYSDCSARGVSTHTLIPIDPGEGSLVDLDFINNQRSRLEHLSRRTDSAVLAGLPSRAALEPNDGNLHGVRYFKRPSALRSRNASERRPRPYPAPQTLLDHSQRAGTAISESPDSAEAVQDPPSVEAQSAPDATPYPLVESETTGLSVGQEAQDNTHW